MRRIRESVCGVMAVLIVIGGPGAVAPARAQELECLIQPRETVGVASPVEGVLERVNVDRGDLVQAGAVVALLEASVERAHLAVARARADQEHALKSGEVRKDFGFRRFERTDKMYKKDLIPFKEMDEAETAKALAEYSLLEAQEQKRLAELEYQRAKAALELKTIRSPITGVVVERLRAPGEYADKTAILKLAQVDPLRVEVFVPVMLLGKVTVGMRAQVTPEAPVGRPLTAAVTVVDKVVDAASGTFGVRLDLPNPGNRLPAGLKCRVSFPLSSNGKQ